MNNPVPDDATYIIGTPVSYLTGSSNVVQQQPDCRWLIASYSLLNSSGVLRSDPSLPDIGMTILPISHQDAGNVYIDATDPNLRDQSYSSIFVITLNDQAGTSQQIEFTIEYKMAEIWYTDESCSQLITDAAAATNHVYEAGDPNTLKVVLLPFSIPTDLSTC